MICPLCLSRTKIQNLESVGRNYFLCEQCNLIFTDTKVSLNNISGDKPYILKAYGQHINSVLRFLYKEFTPSKKVLDYYCGKDPIIPFALEPTGVTCDAYDPAHSNIEIKPPYDFIFATRCFENFFFPAKEIKYLKSLLNPDGYLILMSERWKRPLSSDMINNLKKKKSINIYHENTMEYICQKFGFETIVTDDSPLIVLQNKEVSVYE
ncbi:MAG: methyltransferase domain-containing protein [Cytophagaceae bacterium]